MKPRHYADIIVSKTILLVFTALIGLSVSNQLQAQTTINIKALNSEVKVLGTSNLHDWTMKGSGLTCEAQFTINATSILQLLSLDGLTFSIPVTNLKSSESLLNTRAYKALNADKYSQISFKLSSAVVTPQGGSKYVITAQGLLTISGVTRGLTLVANTEILADGTVAIAGSKVIKMSEFGITPPSFMLGALKTGDKITIDFALKFNEPKLLTAK